MSSAIEVEGRKIHPVWKECAKDLQKRLSAPEARGVLPVPVENFGTLLMHVRATLNQASKDDRIKEPHHQLRSLLRKCENPEPRLQEAINAVPRNRGERVSILLCGGNSDGSRFEDEDDLSEVPHITRHDGARLDFSIAILETRHGVELLGFIFRLQLPEGTTPGFLRIDMNLPGHDNGKDGVRVHLHPGNNDLQIPLPWMSPEEVLKLLLYGLDLNPKRNQGHA